jgi:hypothetical protein
MSHYIIQAKQHGDPRSGSLAQWKPRIDIAPASVDTALSRPLENAMVSFAHVWHSTRRRDTRDFEIINYQLPTLPRQSLVKRVGEIHPPATLECRRGRETITQQSNSSILSGRNPVGLTHGSAQMSLYVSIARVGFDKERDGRQSCPYCCMSYSMRRGVYAPCGWDVYSWKLAIVSHACNGADIGTS